MVLTMRKLREDYNVAHEDEDLLLQLWEEYTNLKRIAQTAMDEQSFMNVDRHETIMTNTLADRQWQRIEESGRNKAGKSRRVTKEPDRYIPPDKDRKKRMSQKKAMRYAYSDEEEDAGGEGWEVYVQSPSSVAQEGAAGGPANAQRPMAGMGGAAAGPPANAQPPMAGMGGAAAGGAQVAQHNFADYRTAQNPNHLDFAASIPAAATRTSIQQMYPMKMDQWDALGPVLQMCRDANYRQKFSDFLIYLFVNYAKYGDSYQQKLYTILAFINTFLTADYSQLLNDKKIKQGLDRMREILDTINLPPNQPRFLSPQANPDEIRKVVTLPWRKEDKKAHREKARFESRGMSEEMKNALEQQLENLNAQNQDRAEGHFWIPKRT